MSEAMSCLRCGDFLTEDSTAVVGIPYCRACAEREQGAGLRVMVAPPRGVFLKRMAILLPYSLAGILIGLGLGLAFGEDWFLPFIGAQFGFTAFTFLGIALGFSRMQHSGSEEWRRRLVSKLGLEAWLEREDLSLHLVLAFFTRPSWFMLRIPMEIGILVSCEGGLMFFGGKGRRLALPLRHIAAADCERLKFYPPRTALHLELRPEARQHTRIESEHVLAAFLDQPSFRANKAKAQEYAAAIKERLQLRSLRG